MINLQETKIINLLIITLSFMFVISCSNDGTGPANDSISISSITPSNAAAGTEVTIEGTGFSSTAEENTVTFAGGSTASITSATSNSLNIVVPEGAQSGTITIVVNGKSAASNTSFTLSEQAEIPEPYASLPGTKIAKDETWSTDTTLAGPHFVLPGVTLTVEKGVQVSFKYHNEVSEDVGTIITLPADDQNFSDSRESGKLIANGTKSEPIIFTGVRKEVNSWGGIILGGVAPINVPGGQGNMEGLNDDVQYGGTNDEDNSGSLKYVRIEYTGYSIAEGSELQGLTLYAVGSETTIDHVNIYVSSDDGFEIFGGTVDLKYMVIYGADDDSFDIDQGWQGNGQFWLAVQRPGADNGFENDGCANLSNCSGGNGPTTPTISNVTVFGAKNSPNKDNYGLKLRENFQADYSNMIVSNFSGYNWLLDGRDNGDDDDADKTYENYGSTLSLNNFVLQNNGGWESGSNGSVRYSTSYVETSSSSPADLFTNPAGYDFSLPSGSPYLSGGSIPSDGFFDDVAYRGAFGTTDWTRDGSWVLWPQN